MSLACQLEVGYTDEAVRNDWAGSAVCSRLDADYEGEDTRVYNLANKTDAELVRLAQAGDFELFGELVRRYRNEVYGLAWHFVGNREEAWDLSQEAFAKAYRSLRSYRGEGDFKAWLMRITANQCKDYFKKRRLPTVSLQSVQAGQWATGTSADPAQAAQQAEMDGAIRSALAKLPEKHRRAFVLREFEGLSYAKMAEVMGCNVGTVMSRLHHARRKMRSLLTAMGMGVVEEKTDD